MNKMLVENKYKTVEPNEVIRALELRLNQSPKIKNNWYNFTTCLSCGTSSKDNYKFGVCVSDNSLYVSCLGCDFKTKSKEDYQRLYNFLGLNQDSSYQYKNEFHNTTKEITPKVSLETLNQVLEDLYNILDQSEDHKQRFYNKRGFIMPDDYKSMINPGRQLEPLIIKYGIDTIKSIFGYGKKESFNCLQDRVIIFHRDFNNRIVYYRSYSFTADKRFKKLSPRNISGLKLTIPFRLELIKPEINRLIITEGEEKADASNIYRLDNQLFISIPGISNYSCLLPIIEKINNNETNIKTISVILDKSTKKDLNEEKASIRILSHIDSILNADVALNICELPMPEQTDKNDLDSFLKSLPEDIRQSELQKILDNPYSLKEYHQINLLIPKKIKPEHVKPLWKQARNKNKDYIKLDVALSEYTTLIKVTNDNLVSLGILPPGSGKTFKTIQHIKELDKPSIIALPTTIQRNDIATNNNFQIVESLTDKSIRTINSDSRFTKDEKINHIECIKKLISTGNSSLVYYYLSSLEIIIKECTIDKSKTQVMTHKMLFNSDNYFNDDRYGLIYIDECPFNVLIDKYRVDYRDLLNYKHLIKDIYIDDNKDLIDFIDIIHVFINNSSQDLHRKALNKELLNVFRSKRTSFNKIVDSLSNNDIKLDEKKILSKLKKSFSEIDNIPKYDFMNEFIKAFKQHRVNFKKDNLNSGYFEFSVKKILPVTNKQIIITDGTANPELYKHWFNCKVIKPTVKPDNIKYTLICDKTYTASYLDIDKTLNDIKDIAKNDLTLVVVAMDIKEKIECLLPENIKVIHYNSSENKGTNDYGHYKKVICFPPKINFDSIIEQGLCLDPTITENNYHYKNISTGYIENNSECFLNIKTFKNKTLKALLENSREAEIYQSLFRIKRRPEDYKEFYVFGNISLNQFGLIPDEIIIKKDTNKVSQIRNKEDFETVKSHLECSIDKLGFYSSLFTLFEGNNKAETLVNNDKRLRINIIYNIDLNAFINDCNSLKLNSSNKKTISKYLSMLCNNSDFIKVSLPLKDNPKHSIYCLPGNEDQAIMKAKEFFKDVLLSEVMKQDYQINHTDNVNIDIGNSTDSTLLYKNRVDEQIINDSIDIDVAYAKYSDKHFELLTSKLHNHLHIKASNSSIISIKDIDLLEQQYYHFIETNDLDRAFNTRFLLESFTEDFIELNNDIYDIMKRFVRPLISLSDIDANISIRLLDPEINSILNSIFDPINTTEVSKEVLESIEIENESKSDILNSYKLSIEGDKIKADSFNRIEIAYHSLVNRERKAHISSSEREKTLRKNLSIVLLTRHRIDKEYLKRVQKWTYKALDVDEYIRRSNYYELIEASSQYINLLIA